MAYLNVDEVSSATVALSAAFPETCELVTLPEATHEGRTCHALRIGSGPLDDRPSILIVGGQHAREWGSCEICIGAATDLLDAHRAGTGLVYGGQGFDAATIRRIVESAQVFVFPLVNPDGRHHSQTEFAMWRKNRNPAGAVDLNRNYDMLWDFRTALHPASGAAVSDNPASDTYHGTAPFSEPESRNVRWMLDTFPQIRWCIDIHSFGGLLYHVWGHDENQTSTPAMNFLDPAFDGRRGLAGDAYREYVRPEDLDEQARLVGVMHDALRAVRGVSYATGQSFELYPTTGTLSDYPYSRHLADPSLPRVHGILIEWGTEFQPPWAEMERIVLDVSSSLVAFADQALREVGPADATAPA
jgi:murein tripeptide amidase MpaA